MLCYNGINEREYNILYVCVVDDRIYGVVSLYCVYIHALYVCMYVSLDMNVENYLRVAPSTSEPSLISCM